MRGSRGGGVCKSQALLVSSLRPLDKSATLRSVLAHSSTTINLESPRGAQQTLSFTTKKRTKLITIEFIICSSHRSNNVDTNRRRNLFFRKNKKTCSTKNWTPSTMDDGDFYRDGILIGRKASFRGQSVDLVTLSDALNACVISSNVAGRKQPSGTIKHVATNLARCNHDRNRQPLQHRLFWVSGGIAVAVRAGRYLCGRVLNQETPGRPKSSALPNPTSACPTHTKVHIKLKNVIQCIPVRSLKASRQKCNFSIATYL